VSKKLKQIFIIPSRVVLLLWALATSFIKDLCRWIKKETSKIGPPD